MRITNGLGKIWIRKDGLKKGAQSALLFFRRKNYSTATTTTAFAGISSVNLPFFALAL